MTFNPCAIIPSRNHHVAVPGIVARLAENGLAVFIIDDGSDAPARDALARLHAPDRGVTVHRLAINQGKGGAVIAGVELAVAAGFTHAVQIDADGQHDLASLPQLLACGRREPGALILGQPVYDATAPLGRRIGRWLTHIWICIETLSLRVIDGMCGFRLYPLAPTMTVLRRARVGRRMDFDPEMLVRLVWLGVPVVTLPLSVTYPAGNTSNFRMLRDNWAITRMHTRLVFAMLPRLPRLILRRRGTGTASRHWSGLKERGAYWGLCLLAAAYRLLGRYGCLALLLPVTLYFHLTGAEQRRASRLFLGRAFAARGETRQPGALDSFRHALAFARNAVDTFAAWIGRVDPAAVEVVDRDTLDVAAAGSRGLVLVVSHLGNIELSRATLDRDRRSRLTVLVHTRHAENYARLLQRFRPEAALNTMQVTEVNPGTIIDLKERIDGGGWVAIAGDRTPVHGDGRISRADFLGHEAGFPQGPYLLAHLLECPLYLMVCLREDGRYRLYFERLAERIDLPRPRREAALADHAAHYARRLEAYCLRDPFQWYNFFDFWAAGKPEKAGVR